MKNLFTLRCYALVLAACLLSSSAHAGDPLPDEEPADASYSIEDEDAPGGEGDSSRSARDRSHDPCIALLLPFKQKRSDLGAISGQIAEVAEFAARGAYLRIKLFDTGDEEKQLLDALQRAHEEPCVIAAIGPLGFKSSQRLATGLRAHPLLAFSLHADESLDGLSPTMFRMRHSPAAYARAIAREAYTTHSVRRVAILMPTHDYGKEAALAFGQAFTREGGELAGLILYDPEEEDLRKPIKALSGQYAYIGPRDRAGKRRADRDGYVRVTSKKTIDFDAVFIPDFHDRVSKILPLLPIAGIQSGAGEGSGKPVTLLGMPSWQGASMRVTEAHAAGALYYDAFGGEHSGGLAEEFVLMFETELGRKPVDLEAEIFDVVHLVGSLWRTTSRKPAIASDSVRRRTTILSLLPRPERPWHGVAGGWAYEEEGGAFARTMSLFEFDIDGEVIPLD